MIDYVLTFQDETKATRDPIASKFYDAVHKIWSSETIPRLICFRPADMQTVQTPDGPSQKVVPFDSNFRLAIAQRTTNNELAQHANLELIYDRDNHAVLQFKLGNVADYKYSPQFAGTSAPHG